MYIDTHTHLFSDAFEEDYAQTIQMAISCGVEKMVLPAIEPASFDNMERLCALYPNNCYPTIGLHPTHVNNNPTFLEDLKEVERRLSAAPSKYVAIGECGLDLYWSKDFASQQTEALEYQIMLSKKYSLPLIIHTRDAFGQMIEVLARNSGASGIIHGFSGTLQHYQKIKSLGNFLFGIGGVITFKNSPLQEVVQEMELGDLVLETDSPYLTPAPHRGTRNQSSYIPLIARKLSDIKAVPIEEIEQATTQNAKRLFKTL